MTQCRKIWRGQRVHKWRYNTAHTHCMLDKQGYMHVRAYTRPRARRQKCVILIAFPRNDDSRTRLSVTLYVHCLSCPFPLHSSPLVSHPSIFCLVLLFFLFLPLRLQQFVSAFFFSHSFNNALIKYFCSLLDGSLFLFIQLQQVSCTQLWVSFPYKIL